MPFIGNQPADKFLTLEKQVFTTSATDTYSLDREVSSVNDIELFLNNVRQEPTEAYTISGTTLTLASAITASDSMYCIYQGRAVGTQSPAVGSVTNDMLAGSIATSKLANQNIGFRNLIINGDMSIAQRGTSVSSITSSGYYTIDRWRGAFSDCGTWTMSQSTDVPTGQGFAYSQKWDCTTAKTPLASGSLFYLNYRIEAQNLTQLKYGTSSAESMTVSFWVKSNKTGTYSLLALQRDNSDKMLTKTYTIDSANTWEKKTIIIPSDTSGVINNDNGEGLSLYWILSAGSNRTSGSINETWATYDATDEADSSQVNLADNTANEWYITGVQLEVGTSASDFEFLPYDVNLDRCYRYFQRYTSAERVAGFVGNSDAVFTQNMLRKDMRSQPTISVSGVLSFDEYYVSGRTQSASDLRRNSGSTMSVICIAGNFSSMTRSNAGGLYNANMDMDAEL